MKCYRFRASAPVNSENNQRVRTHIAEGNCAQMTETAPNLITEAFASGSAKLRILAVEDEQIVARDLRFRLMKLGYEVAGLAASKAEALDLVERAMPDLVLMDIRLNGIPEGIDAAGEIRKRFDLPVVYLTGHSDADTLSRAKLTEPFGYILKPFEDRELQVLIETAVYKHKTERCIRERLQRSNSDLEAYAYTISHDLREPLRSISCYLELLERRCGPKLDEPARGFISFAQQGAHRMRELLDGLLEFSRAGQDSCPMTRVDCNSVITAVLESLSAGIQESGARIFVGWLPTARGWAVRLHQLFQNLIGNALKYRNPNVAPQINVWAQRDGDAWLFTVKDNGIGFDMKHADDLFVVFKRLHTSDCEGTGVGLSVCKRIVERHGGRIWAESVPGQGSAFHFTIPASL
jgi:signal transduction histidine kinase